MERMEVGRLGQINSAARILKRRFICIEKDAEYWRASVERLEEAKRQGELF